MASRIIHWVIGEKLLAQKAFRYFDRNQFLLGNLLPDAHDGTLSGNSRAHFRRRINGEYAKVPDIDYLSFQNKYASHLNKSIVAGYYCHLLSDYKWVNHRFISNHIATDSEEYISQRMLMHRDFGLLNALLIEHFKLHPVNFLDIPYDIIVQEADKSFIPTISRGLEQDFENRPEGELSLLKMDLILVYIDEAVAFCMEKLQV